jgi:hypothetical protein
VTDDTEATESRPRGEAAWKAARDATEQRNAAVKRRAQEHRTTTAAAAAERERWQALAESAELQVLNEQIGAREAGRQELQDYGKGRRGLER